MIRSLSIVLALALTGCGFHFRGALELPPDLGPVQVRSVDRYSPLADSLSQSMASVGAQIATDPLAEATVLDLLSERWADTPLAVDQFGRAQEFSLRYAVVFELRRPDGSISVPRQAIELSRDYISNPVNTIGTDGERDILIRELRRDMAAAILRRLGTVARARIAAAGSAAPEPTEAAVEPVAADAARAALDAADANPPPAAAAQAAPSQPR